MKARIFNKLFIFGYDRTPLQAMGFYLAYFMITSIMSALAAGAFIYYYSFLDVPADTIGKIAWIAISVIGCFSLHVMVMARKGFETEPFYIFLALITFSLALVSGSIGGLIPVTYLTTKKSMKS